jgi:hypothetical protein
MPDKIAHFFQAILAAVKQLLLNRLQMMLDRGRFPPSRDCMRFSFCSELATQGVCSCSVAPSPVAQCRPFPKNLMLDI